MSLYATKALTDVNGKIFSNQWRPNLTVTYIRENELDDGCKLLKRHKTEFISHKSAYRMSFQKFKIVWNKRAPNDLKLSKILYTFLNAHAHIENYCRYHK